MRAVMKLAMPHTLPKRLNSFERVVFGHNGYFRLADGLERLKRRRSPHRQRDRGSANDCDQVASDRRVHLRNSIIRTRLQKLQ